MGKRQWPKSKLYLLLLLFILGSPCHPEVNPTFYTSHYSTIRGRGGSGTPQPCWTGTSCCWAGTAATARSPGSLCPPSTVATMSLPSVAGFALGTWWKREDPPTKGCPTEEGVILHLQQCVLPRRAVGTIGVIGLRSSVLAVETVSLLAVEAAIPRKEQVNPHLKPHHFSLLSQKAFSLTWFTMQLVDA